LAVARIEIEYKNVIADKEIIEEVVDYYKLAK
jgi:hypothetical protein